MSSTESNAKNNVEVSIVSAWYERADYILDTVNSLLGQAHPNFEVVIVNDGSPDPKVKEILDSFNDPRLKVIHQENTGFTKAIKVAIKASCGEFIAIQGAGDVSHPQRLNEQVQVFRNNPRIGIVGCYYTKKNMNKLDDVETIKPSDVRSSSLTFELSKKIKASHGELMYRRTFYEQSGGYREYFNVGQGSDLWARMLLLSDLVTVPKVLYEQRIFSDGVSANYQKVFHRTLLHGVWLEERNAVLSGIQCPIKDPQGIYMPLYLVSRNSLSKRYFTVLLICYALQIPEASYYRKLAIANSNNLFSAMAWLAGFIPFKPIWAKAVASKSSIYTRLVRDIEA